MKKILSLFVLLALVAVAQDPGGYGARGVASGTITSITNSLGAIQTDLSTLGDVTNSYVTVDGVKYSFVYITEEGRPFYFSGTTSYGIIFQSGLWQIGGLFTNSSLAYYPPSTNWYSVATGLATNLNIKFFSGTDALQQAQIADGSGVTDPAAFRTAIEAASINDLNAKVSTNAYAEYCLVLPNATTASGISGGTQFFYMNPVSNFVFDVMSIVWSATNASLGGIAPTGCVIRVYHGGSQGGQASTPLYNFEMPTNIISSGIFYGNKGNGINPIFTMTNAAIPAFGINTPIFAIANFSGVTLTNFGAVVRIRYRTTFSN